MKKNSEEVRDKERIIENFDKRARQQDQDFDLLMDVKIALALEIKAYRLLLENEEDRIGVYKETNETEIEADGETGVTITEQDGLQMEEESNAKG